jgi:hypothetical protein
MLFKSSRFDILKEDSGVGPRNGNFPRNSRRRDDFERKANSPPKSKPLPELDLSSLNDFPSLGKTPIVLKGAVEKSGGYINTLKKLQIVEEKVDLPEGWIEIKKGCFKNTELNTEKLELSEIEINIIINNLCDKYERFYNDYIKQWGLIEYEKMFSFPDYDYNYFDKLDEEYYESLNDLENK